MEGINCLTHVTSDINRISIQQSGTLLATKETNPKNLLIDHLPLRQSDAPAGVWFGASLYKGQLPTISPYGNCRVLMPLGCIVDQLGPIIFLFKEGEYTVNFGFGQVRYIRLILCSQTQSSWMVLKRLEQLDISNNIYLTLQFPTVSIVPTTLTGPIGTAGNTLMALPTGATTPRGFTTGPTTPMVLPTGSTTPTALPLGLTTPMALPTGSTTPRAFTTEPSTPMALTTGSTTPRALSLGPTTPMALPAG